MTFVQLSIAQSPKKGCQPLSPTTAALHSKGDAMTLPGVSLEVESGEKDENYR